MIGDQICAGLESRQIQSDWNDLKKHKLLFFYFFYLQVIVVRVRVMAVRVKLFCCDRVILRSRIDYYSSKQGFNRTIAIL